MRQTLRTHWPILVILLLAISLRLPLLTGSFWMDEAAQALESARPWSEQLQIRDDFQPPLLHLITAVAIRVDQSEWWLRLWGALIPGLLSIVFIYAIGVELGWKKQENDNISPTTSRTIGSIAALLLATSSFHIFYSQELRQYALPTLWATFSWWILLRQRYWQVNTKRWWIWGVGWSIVSLLGLYSSYLYPFLLLSQIVYVVWESISSTLREKQTVIKKASLFQRLKVISCPLLSWLVLFLLIKIGFLLWIPSFLDQLSAGQLLRTEIPGWESVVSTPQFKAIALVGGKFLFGVTNLQLNAWFGIYTGVFLVVFILVIWQWTKLKQSKPIKHHLFLLLTWLLVPLLSAWLISFVVPVLQPKRVLYLLPAWCLLIGYLVTPLIKQSQQKIGQLVGLTLISILLIFNLSSTVLYWLDPHLQRENWRDLYLEIQTRYGSPRMANLFIFDAPFASWQWYDAKFEVFSQMNDFSLMDSRVATPANAKLLVQWASNGYTKPRLVYFDYLTDLTDPQHLVIQELEAHNYQQTDLLDYPNIGFIRVFEKQDSESVATN